MKAPVDLILKDIVIYKIMRLITAKKEHRELMIEHTIYR
jgi:hypothetical protein